MNSLPLEIIYQIVGFISNPTDFRNTGCLSKLFHEIIHDSIIQKNAKQKMKKFISKNDCINRLSNYFILPNGQFIGEYKKWYNNGNLEKLCFYDDNGKLNEEYKIWYNNGNLFTSSFYKNGHQIGEIKKYYYNGILMQYCYYKEIFCQEGEDLEFHENGNLKDFKFYKNSFVEGEVTEWYDNGVLATRCCYKEGYIKGAYTEWYENGNLKRWFPCLKNTYSSRYSISDEIYIEYNENGTFKKIYQT